MDKNNLPKHDRRREDKRLIILRGVIDRVSQGDFDVEVPKLEPGDDFEPLFEGIQKLVDIARDKNTEAIQAQQGLAEAVAKRTEQLEESQSQLMSLVNYAPSYIQIVDKELKIKFINRVPQNWKLADIVGKKVGSMSSPEIAKVIRSNIRKVFKTGEPVQYEHCIKDKDKTFWFKTNAGPIYDGDKINSVVLMTVDITEDKLHLDAIEAARFRDQALLNSIGEGLIVIDDRGHISNVNPSAARMLGYSEEELLGEWFPSAVPAFDDRGNQTDHLDRPALRALSTGHVVSETVRYRHKDGTTFPVAITISPVVIEGRPVGAIEVFRDLTKERQLEQAKEEFVSLASHQLRTPATGVKAYISMLLDGYAGSLTAEQRGFLDKVFHTNERQLQIVNDMLNVARIDAGRMIPEITSTNLTSLVKDIIDEQKSTIEGRIQIVREDLPNYIVEA